jgi:predicted RNase H-like HicB family nuclease
MNESKITLALHLEIGIRRDGNEYIAHCIPLDVFSQGPSKAEAKASLKEAVELWFESCVQRGVLTEALREAGFIQGPTATGIGAHPVPVHDQKADSSSGFTLEYIDVLVPAYIAA